MKYLQRSLAIGATMVASIATQAAQAQIEGSRSGSSSMSYVPREHVWEVVGNFGRCFALQNWPEAFELLATEPGSRAEAETYRRIFRSYNQSCLSDVTEMRVAPALIRGAIAEGLYRRGYAVPPNLVLSAPASGSTIRTFSEAARCYTATHRDQVRALIMDTRPGSRREMEAIDAMTPEFSRCVPGTARGYRFDATEIRFRLAEALLRMPGAQAAVDPQ